MRVSADIEEGIMYPANGTECNPDHEAMEKTKTDSFSALRLTDHNAKMCFLSSPVFNRECENYPQNTY